MGHKKLTKSEKKFNRKRLFRCVVCVFVLICIIFTCDNSFYAAPSPARIYALLGRDPDKFKTDGATAEEETQEAEDDVIMVYLLSSSIEKDLKIKVVDEEETLIEGQEFEITVYEADAYSEAAQDETGAEGELYADDDADGIIYIEEIEAGDYIVELSEIEGYEIAENAILVTVTGEIAYEYVDVTSEIKTESQVNVATEDTKARTASASSSSSSSSSSSDSDLIESTKSVNSVSKDEVDTSSFPGSSVSGETSVTVYKTSSSSSDVSAVITIASDVLLYNSQINGGNTASVTASVSGDSSIITGYEWSISDQSVVSLSASGSSAKLTAAAYGTASLTLTVTYTSSDSGETAAASLSCTVTVSGYTGTAQLTDLSGNLLYLDEDGLTAATIADYLSYDIFYLAPVYTGWQTINGNVYYFDENGQAVTGVQMIDGIRYYFSDEGVLQDTKTTTGIDVSKWQGTIDWEAVADAGIDFAIIRVGYRGYSTGVLVEDSYFEKNIKGATAAGIKVGVYFFSQAITQAEAVEEASMVISLISGYNLTYPVFIDTEESGGRADSLTKTQRTAVVLAFLKTITNSGYSAGVYASKNWYTDNLNASLLSSYTIWVAQYSSTLTYTGKYDIWQYSQTGTVDGISGNVDMNISYLGY